MLLPLVQNQEITGPLVSADLSDPVSTFLGQWAAVIVCVTTITVPVHLHGTNFAPFSLLTRRCYDAETSAILLLLKSMISFLKSFGEVIVSSNLRETKGYSPGVFFCGPKKSGEKSKPF